MKISNWILHVPTNPLSKGEEFVPVFKTRTNKMYGRCEQPTMNRHLPTHPSSRHKPWAMIRLGSVQPFSVSQQGFWWGLRKQETKWQYDRLGTVLGGSHSSITEMILSWILFHGVFSWPAKTKVWGFVLGEPRCTEWELRSWKAWVDLSFSLHFFLTGTPFELLMVRFG